MHQKLIVPNLSKRAPLTHSIQLKKSKRMAYNSPIPALVPSADRDAAACMQGHSAAAIAVGDPVDSVHLVNAAVKKQHFRRQVGASEYRSIGAFQNTQLRPQTAILEHLGLVVCFPLK